MNEDVQKEGFAEHVKRSLIERGILRADVQIEPIRKHLTGKAYSVDSMVTVKILRVETAVYKNRTTNESKQIQWGANPFPPNSK